MCRHVKKLVMANEIARLGGLILFYFLNLVILNELIVKYIIGFGRFMRILKD